MSAAERAELEAELAEMGDLDELEAELAAPAPKEAKAEEAASAEEADTAEDNSGEESAE